MEAKVRGTGRLVAVGIFAGVVHLAAVPVGFWVTAHPFDSSVWRFLIWGPHGRYFYPVDFVILAAIVTVWQLFVGLVQLGLVLRIRANTWPESSAMIAGVVGGGSMFLSAVGVGGVFALLGGTLAAASSIHAWARLTHLDSRAYRRFVSSLGPAFIIVFYMWASAAWR